MNYPLPPSISDLPRQFCQENTPKGKQFTMEVEYYYYSPERPGGGPPSPWMVKFQNSPKKEFGKVTIFYNGERHQETKGVVAMASAMECADHWERTGYVPKVTGKCLADLAPASRIIACLPAATNSVRPEPIKAGRKTKAAKRTG